METAKDHLQNLKKQPQLVLWGSLGKGHPQQTQATSETFEK
jgi:tripartite-type tricarboxylate transporter receptor subunit TctC